MKKSLFLLLIICQFAFSQKKQKVEYYNFGHNGMEFVGKSESRTIIISTFNSKMTIRQEIARKIFDMYLDNQLNSETIISINGNLACVTGKCVIRKKDNLTLVDFYYESVEWESGLKEVYKKKRVG